MTSESGSQANNPRRVGDELSDALGGDLPRDKKRQFNRIARGGGVNDDIMKCAEDLALLAKLVKSSGS
ncbi:conserved hypothetical protein [Vibrio phage 150E35-1]|nr:conserved hypothetical protein [Vibrio phage 150E35-1]